jgi:hypothetical protein
MRVLFRLSQSGRVKQMPVHVADDHSRAHPLYGWGADLRMPRSTLYVGAAR